MTFNLSIIIPVLNEEKNIRKLCLKINHYLKNIKYEIIVVDDNSEDNTVLEVNKINKKNISCIVRKNKTKDLSKSCALGIINCNYNNILIMDGDLQHNPKYIPKFINYFVNQRADIIIGIRDFSRRRNLGFIRYYSSKLIILFFNTFLGFKTKDSMSGFFLFKKKLYIKNKKKLFNNGFKILADLLYVSKKRLLILECPILFNRRIRDKSKMNIKVLMLIIQFFFIKLFRK